MTVRCDFANPGAVPAPRVTVICIFYNGERFFREAIESVLAQDFDDFELLLVDDGSADASTAIARDYADRFSTKVRYLEHEHHANRGMSATRNLGLHEAGGELIAFIDADDVWRPGKLGEQVAILQSRPDVAMVCGTVNYWSGWEGGRDRLVPTGPVHDRSTAPPETLLALYPLGFAHAPCPSDVMVRRAAAEAVGAFEEEFTGFYEDMTFFAKIYASQPVFFSSKVWLDYRQHGGSSSSATTRQHYRDIRSRFLEWLNAYVAERELPGKERVLRSIAVARWETSHPVAGRAVRFLRRMAS